MRTQRRLMEMVVGCVVVFLAVVAQAQFTTDYQTNIIDSVTNNWSGHYYVGSNTVSDLLLIRNGGFLDIEGGKGYHFYIGYDSGAVSNTVIIDGPNSELNATGYLAVGYQGDYSTLIVTNGGVVNGASWGAYVGWFSKNCRAVVTGSNSTWTSDSHFVLGAYNSGSRFSILNGGAAHCKRDVALGQRGGNNVIEVSGVNSLLRCDRSFIMGWEYSTGCINNSLIVTNGGTVWVRDIDDGKGVIIGLNAGVNGNYVQVDGGSLIVTNAISNTPGIDVLKGALTLNSGKVITERLYLTSELGFIHFNGGSLATYGTSVSNGTAFVVGDGTDTATLALMTGTHTFFDGVTISSNAVFATGGTNAIGTATVNGDVTLQTDAVLDCDFNGSTNDWTQITGVLSLPVSATLSLRSLDGETPMTIPILEATTISGSADDWSVFRFNELVYRADVSGNQLLLMRVLSGTVINIR